MAIETFDARGEKLSRGSGFFIDIDRVVTNRHVIEGAYRAEVHLNSGHTFQVKNVLAVDAEGDVALLKVDAPPNLVRPLRSIERRRRKARASSLLAIHLDWKAASRTE